MVAAAGGTDGDGFHAPGVSEFFPDALFFEGTPFEINRIVLVRLLAVAILLFLFWLGLRKPKLIPGRGQSVAELGLGFVKNQIADEILGERLGRNYLPLLAGTFWGILAMNVTGVIPLLNIAGTSIFVMPLMFALAAYIAFIYAGFKEVGPGKFFKTQLFPSGVPWPIYIILTPVELLNIFIVRPLSLALRLTLNMMVGHLLLVLCFAATHFFFFSTSGLTTLFGGLTLVAGIAFTVFELIVALLQAYVFTLLTAVYIQQSVEEH
ncbi:F0F1 ATP synthase subunit A [Humidisolicoccus flavus]|uniref:F0F1 ATP synthase subunit A n=1 Tax=Humidisolicoccus flavus TaxID=3111414 RepID=UPI003251441A